MARETPFRSRDRAPESAPDPGQRGDRLYPRRARKAVTGSIPPKAITLPFGSHHPTREFYLVFDVADGDHGLILGSVLHRSRAVCDPYLQFKTRAIGHIYLNEV